MLGVGDRQLLTRQVRLVDRLRGNGFRGLLGAAFLTAAFFAAAFLVAAFGSAFFFDVFVMVSLSVHCRAMATRASAFLASASSWSGLPDTSTVTLEMVPVNGNGDAYRVDVAEPGLRPTAKPLPSPSASGTVTGSSRLAHLLAVDEEPADAGRALGLPSGPARPVGSNS